jgi:hypothetical protein
MVHKLAIAAIIGLSTCAVCMGAAAAIGGQEIGKTFDGMDFSMFGDQPRCEAVAGATATSRDLDWDGSDSISLSVPGTSRYSPTNDRKVHITGDPQALAHIRVRDGHIEMNCNGHWRFGDTDIAITLPGGEFKKFSIAGSGRLTLDNLNQEKLKVSIAGSGNIKANGKVGETEIHIAGSGDADLGQVATRETTVRIAGSGNTDIAPTEGADIHIAGSGDVNLHTNPKRLETHIAGSGRIHNVGTGG